MHNPEVTYRSIFDVEKDPAQWHTAFEQANKGLGLPLAHTFNLAWEKAAALPIPQQKMEKWRWLDFSHVGLADGKVWTNPELKLDVEFIPAKEGGPKPDERSHEGLVITTFADALRDRPDQVASFLDRLDKPASEKFQVLAEALARNGLFVHVPKGLKVEGVAVVNVHGKLNPGMTATRVLIWLEPGAELKLVLDSQNKLQHGEGTFLQLSKTDLLLEDDSRLHFSDVSIFHQEVVTLLYNQARLGRAAKLEWIHAAVATVLGKQSVEVSLEGEGADAELKGFYFPSQGQKISIDTVQNHLAPHTRSNLLFRGAANGNGEAIWRGMIFVDPIAQRTDGYQSNQNLMLGDRSEIKSIPGLEICADDVSCSHGATVGSIDEMELFYLEARGIPRGDAVRLIVDGFFAEIIELIPDEKTRNRVSERLIEKFDAS